MNPVRPATARQHAGFTLIEILAAMVIMSMIMLVLGNIFSVSQKTMRVGQEMVDQTARGRAVVDFMARELSEALVDPDLGLKLESDFGPAIPGSSAIIPSPDRITFVTQTGAPQNNGERAFKQVQYYLKGGVNSNDADAALNFDRFGLMRKVQSTGMDEADLRDGELAGGAASLLMDFVRTIEIWVYADPDITNGDYEEIETINDYEYPGTNAGPPLYIELYVEIVSEDDARLAAEGAVRTWGTIPVRRYFRRVYMNNVLPELLAIPNREAAP